MALPIGRAARYNEGRTHTLFGKPTMRRILSLCLLLALTWPCHAQQKPNTLTPKEIADGWILLFDGETTFGWTAEKDAIRANDGILEIGGKTKTKSLARLPFAGALWSSNFELSFEMSAVYNRDGTDGGFVQIVFSHSNEKGTASRRYPVVDWRKVTFSCVGTRMYHPGGNYAYHSDTVHFEADATVKLLLRNIKYRRLNAIPLFNDTDLTGWREFPGKKSKFAVIDNAINVKDGPGDLQTVGKYKDFILQLECKSNGKHLNSGIFFRCRDNEYQNGYECQIRNEFKPEATQKYLIEEYDPKTNKLIGKKETLFTAVDYGTGAIYKRQPARKQMSKDGEWFGMTIVAHGNHLATWVNGVQVTDFYDNRERKDNARNGCKLEAGHISIQGHDPTTDLSFKNIRIAEFK
jgi:hypothetical protein